MVDTSSIPEPEPDLLPAGAPVEVEAKLCLAADARLPPFEVDGATLTGSREERLETVYWDTADRALAARGSSLRHRDGGSWTAKRDSRTTGTVLVRAERHYEGGAGEPPGDALAFLEVADRAADLRRVVSLRVRRVRRDLRSPATSDLLVDVIDDDVEVRDPAGAVVGGFRELELEVCRPEGRPLLETLLARLDAAGVRSGAPMPKYERALAHLPVRADG